MHLDKTAIFSICLAFGAVFASRAGAAQNDPCSRTTARQTARGMDGVKLVLVTDIKTVSLQDSLVLDVALRNDGQEPIFVYADIGWGYGAGLVIRLRNHEGQEIGPVFRDDRMLPPPPSNDDPAIFTRLDRDNFFGTRRKLALKDLVTTPGKYTLQIEYRSPLPCRFVDPKLQRLPALWHEDASIFSNQVAIEVLP